MGRTAGAISTALPQATNAKPAGLFGLGSPPWAVTRLPFNAAPRKGGGGEVGRLGTGDIPPSRGGWSAEGPQNTKQGEGLGKGLLQQKLSCDTLL